jgi:predicted metalloprotease with PDZ domain
MKHTFALAGACFFLCTAPTLAQTQQAPVTLVVDASQAARGIARVHETIPVSGGTVKLVYPKWIPGEHGPTGPLNNLVSMRFSASGKTLGWRRDTIDLYGFHVDVPSGARTIDADFMILMNSDATMATHTLAIINWNRYILYTDGINSHDYFVKPSIVLPAGWEFGNALRDPKRTGDRVDFAVTPLDELIDSPLDMGAYVKKWTLWSGEGSFVEFDAFGGRPQDLDVPEKLVDAYKRIPARSLRPLRFAPLRRLSRTTYTQRRSRL